MQGSLTLIVGWNGRQRPLKSARTPQRPILSRLREQLVLHGQLPPPARGRGRESELSQRVPLQMLGTKKLRRGQRSQHTHSLSSPGTTGRKIQVADDSSGNSFHRVVSSRRC